MTDVTHQPTASPPSRSTDADRDPDGFRAGAWPAASSEYGFAIIRDHGIPQDLIDRAEEKAKAVLRAARRGQAQLSDPRRRRRARLYAVRDRDRQGRQGVTTSRNSGTSGASLPAGHPLPRGDGRQCLAGRSRRASRRPSSSCTTRSTRRGSRSSRRSRAILGVDEDYFADTVARRQFGDAPAPLSAAERSRPATTSAPARMRTSTPSPCCSAPRKRGWSCKTKDGRWLPVSPKPGELVVNIGDMLQRLTNGVLRSTTHRVVNPAPDRREPCALLDALLPPLPPRFHDRGAARHACRRARSRSGRRSAATIISRSGCARSSSPDPDAVAARMSKQVQPSPEVSNGDRCTVVAGTARRQVGHRRGLATSSKAGHCHDQRPAGRRRPVQDARQERRRRARTLAAELSPRQPGWRGRSRAG